MLDLGAAQDIDWIRKQLRSRFGSPGLINLRTPVSQLVKSLISGRTRDDVSLRAHDRLVVAYPRWSDIASARIADIEATLGDVTFPDVKAQHLRDALRIVMACRPDFDLTFFEAYGVTRAIEWLERLPGVGRKVSASTLNFSTLRMPAFVVDTHILRILRRFGFIRSKADTRTAYDAMMAMLCDWTAGDLAELHILMKRLGQTICRADRAFCGNCPISQRCRRSAQSSHAIL